MRKSLFVAFAVCAVALTTASASAQVWDAANDFSATTNPSDPWSYGQSPTLQGPFQLDNTPLQHSLGMDYWVCNSDLNEGCVGYNGTSSAIWDSATDVSYDPYQVFLHPGWDGTFAIVRWTAPPNASNSPLTMHGGFAGLDAQGGSTDVYVLLNGSPLFAGFVSGFGPGSGPNFTLGTTVSAGDTVDFVVGYGNGDWSDDSTSLDAHITMTPEPSTLALLSIGIVGLLSFGWRRLRGTSAANPWV
jgi:hypothetical protein